MRAPHRFPRRTFARAGFVAAAVAVAVLAGGCGLFGPDVGVEGVDARWIDVEHQPGREALVVTPEGFDPAKSSEKLPAVIILHGLGSDAEDMARLAEWPAAARDRHFVAVFPQGVEDSWNAGGCCGDATAEDVDDVAYLDDLIDQLEAHDGVDPRRIYLTGYSNGGMMTYRYACERPDRLAGAASVAGTDFDDGCEPSEAIPFIQISGDKDPVVPVLGGKSSLEGVPEVPSVEQSILGVARGADCDPPTAAEIADVKVFTSKGCRNGAEVRYDVVGGLDHSYPSAVITPQYVGVDKILDFWGFPPASPPAPQ